jgi:hypothetical protein
MKQDLVEATPDVRLDDQGTIVLVLPLTDRATEWIGLNIPEDAQYFGKALVVEHHYAQDIVDGMTADGLVLT